MLFDEEEREPSCFLIETREHARHELKQWRDRQIRSQRMETKFARSELRDLVATKFAL